ncbi:MAG: phage baseplate assembly protein V, partial [Bacteroidota bacterium]
MSATILPPNGRLSIDVFVKGKSISDALALLDVSVSEALNSVPEASLTFLLPREISGAEIFASSSEKTFAPGTQLEIKAGYDGKVDTIFTGIIEEQVIAMGEQRIMTLALHCQHKAVAMQKTQQTKAYADQTDTEIISSLIKEHGLKADVASIPNVHEQVFQVNTSDWDFALARARQHGMIVYTNGNKVVVKAPALTANPQITFEAIEAFDNVLGFRAATTSPKAKPFTARGKVTIYGTALMALNTTIELKDFGDRFSGPALTTSIRHIIQDNAWQTEIGFGTLPADNVVSVATATTPLGLEQGTVKALVTDPEGLHRIQVTLPALGVDVWAQLSHIYAGNGYGEHFLPEIGDQVITAFVHNNPHQAVVLGSVFSTKDALPYPVSDENHTKALVTRSGLQVVFDDDRQIIDLLTPAGNTLQLSDEGQAVTLSDQNGNQLVLNKNGISLRSTRDISFDATGNLSLKAKGKISVVAKGDLDLDALNILGKAQ